MDRLGDVVTPCVDHRCDCVLKTRYEACDFDSRVFDFGAHVRGNRDVVGGGEACSHHLCEADQFQLGGTLRFLPLLDGS